MERLKTNALIINLGWEQKQLYETLNKFFDNIYVIFFEKEDFFNSSLEKNKKLLINYLNKDKAYEFSKKNKIKYIFSDQCDYALNLQSYLNSKLSLNGVKKYNGELSNDKSKLYNLCKQKRILVPKFWIINKNYNSKKVEGIILKQKKLISKPVDNRGSIGVNLIERKEFKSCLNYSLNNSFKKKIVIQQFVKGENIIVESFKDRVDLIGRKVMSKINPYLNSEIFFSKANNKNRLHKKIISKHKQIIKKTKFNNGFVSAEYIFENNKLWLIELTNRGGGVGISSYIRSSLIGYNGYIDLIADALRINIKKIYELRKIYSLYKFKFINLNYIVLKKKLTNIKYIKLKKIFEKNNSNFFYLWNLNKKNINKVKNAIQRNGLIIYAVNNKTQLKRKKIEIERKLNIY